MLAAFVLQATLSPHIGVGDAVPNFLMVAALSIALFEGPSAGASAGFVAGLVFNLLGYGPVGAMALVLACAGYVAGLLHQQMFAEGVLLPLTVVAITAVLSEVAYGAVLGLLGVGLPFGEMMVRVVLPVAVYNTVIAIGAVPIVGRWLHRGPRIDTLTRLG